MLDDEGGHEFMIGPPAPIDIAERDALIEDLLMEVRDAGRGLCLYRHDAGLAGECSHCRLIAAAKALGYPKGGG